MIVVFCETADLTAPIARSIGDRPSEILDTPDGFRVSVERASLLVIAARDLGRTPIPSLIRDCRISRPTTPVLVVTELDAEHTRGLARVPADDVVWVDELEHRLASRIAGLLESAGRNRLATALENWSEADPILRNALARAVRTDLPPRSVQALCRASGLSVLSARRKWRRAVPSPARIHDFLSLLLALHLEEAAVAAIGRRPALQRLGVDHRTARRACDAFPNANQRLQQLMDSEINVGQVMAKLLLYQRSELATR